MDMIKLRFKHYLLIIAAAFALLANANAAGGRHFNQEQIKTIIPSSSRIVIHLAGTWNKSTDGVNWEQVSIPSSEEESKQIIYTRSIKIEKEFIESRAWNLNFLGFNQQSEIYFNEQFVGRYYSGMTPISVRIPAKMLNAGSNELKIILTPIQNATKQIHTQFISAKKRYFGIIRDVMLIGTPPVWISDIKYKTNIAGNNQSASIKASIGISSGNIEQLSKFRTKDTTGLVISRSRATLSLETQLVKIATGEVIAIGESKQINVESERTINSEITFNVNNPALWSPANPNLYEVRAKITQSGKMIDDYSAIVGFRSIRMTNGDESKMVLNGEKIKIKGVTYIDDHGSTGQSLSPWRMEEDIKLMKTLGANLVRFRFNPPHPYFAYLCDKYGLMMLVELPLYYAPANIINLDEVKVLMKNYSKQYVSAYQNYASLVGYGISEGLNEDDYPMDLAKEYASILKSSGRHLIYKYVPHNSKIVNAEGFDFIGISLTKDYASTEFNSFYVNKVKSLLSGVPFFLSYGSAVQDKNHNGYSDPLSMEHQAYYIRNNNNLANASGAIGSIINTFNDYELNHPYMATNNTHINILTSGITDRYRDIRLSYQMLQSLFNDEKEPLLNAGSYSEQTPITFIIFGLLLISTILFIINRYRRFREYLFRSILRPYNFYSDIRDQRIMSSVQTVLLGLIISFTVGMFISSLGYYYRMDEITQYLIMMKMPSNSLQEITYRMIWMPEIALLILSIFSFLMVFIVSTIIKIFAFFSRARIFYTDCLIITIWSGIPYLILLPIAIVLVRLLDISDAFAVVSVVIFMVISVWVIMRMLKSTSVVFDKPSSQVYMIGLILLLILVGVPLGIYQVRYSLFSYIDYFFQVIV